MFKLRNGFAAVVVLSVSIVTPVFAQGAAGCRNGRFIGTYTHLDTFTDLWADGSFVLHQGIKQLTLHSDGTASEHFTFAPDIMLSQGAISTRIGSWTCRIDGRLVVTMLGATYLPTTDAVSHPAGTLTNPPPQVDLSLANHVRATYLFDVTDENTLTRIELRNRRYTAAQDPTDPNGGTLRPLNTDPVVYSKLVASDSDLLVP